MFTRGYYIIIYPIFLDPSLLLSVFGQTIVRNFDVEQNAVLDRRPGSNHRKKWGMNPRNLQCEWGKQWQNHMKPIEFGSTELSNHVKPKSWIPGLKWIGRRIFLVKAWNHGMLGLKKWKTLASENGVYHGIPMVYPQNVYGREWWLTQSTTSGVCTPSCGHWAIESWGKWMNMRCFKHF